MNAFSSEDRQRIGKSIERRYAAAAKNPEGLFRFPVGREGLRALGYTPAETDGLPAEALDGYCGVGRPFALVDIVPGERVLDLGCGAGVDTLIAGIKVGEHGTAVGVDFVEEMVRRAETNRKLSGAGNVRFFRASGEALPFGDDRFDVVISNGAVNLIPDKLKALREVVRVLKPGGKFVVADQVLAVEKNESASDRVTSWAR